MSPVLELMGRLRDAGVEVWADGETLRFRAPEGALVPELRSELAAAKPDVLAFLGQPALPPLRHGARPGTLSAGQRRFWFLDQAAPADPSHNLPYALRLTGPLDVPTLERALTTLVERHAILRTVYRSVDGEPVAVELEPAPVKVGLGGDLDDEFRVGFDLANGPLLRARLIGGDILALTFHHIAFDGWSWSVFLSELADAYTGLPLAPVEHTYADFTRWQEEFALDTQLDHWRQTLDGAPLTLDLPGDHPRPQRSSYAGDVVWLEDLPPLPLQEGATPFMVGLAAFQTLLSRLSGREELLVGTPVAGRRDAGLDRVIGFFVNMLVLRGDLSGRPTFRELVRRTREATLTAYAHQDVPFDRLVEALQPARDLSRAPVFQTLFALQNAPTSSWPLAEPVNGPTGIAKYDLSLVLQERDGTLRGALEYSTDLFERATAERFARQFAQLLRAVATDPDTPIDRLELSDAAELEAFNDTETTHTDLFLDLFAAQVAARPDAVAVEDEQQALTYAQLDRRANRLANHLRGLGVGPDVCVALQVTRSARMLVGILGILKAGGAYVPLDPDYPAERRAYMFEDCGARVLVADDDLDLGEDADGPDAALHPDHLAYLIYTSGSTGRPKGVQVTQRGLANLVANERCRPDLTPEDTVLAVVTLSFDASVSELLRPLTTGTRVFVAGRDASRDAVQLVALLRKTRATTIMASAAVGRMLVEGGWEGDGRLRICLGGEALTAELASALLARTGEIWNDYGPTETTCFSTSDLIVDAHDIAIGRPIDNTRILILDPRGNVLPAGAIGELCIAGAGVARGYRNRPDLTAERFTPDPTREGERVYRTGDLGRWRPDGRLEYLGRIDDQVKLRGFRIEPGEVEAALESHPAVRQAAALVRGERLVAYVAGPADGLREHLQQRLPEYMIPATFISLDAFPTTPSGKVDRQALPDPEPERREHVEPATATERRVAAAWSEVLGVDGIGATDDFFALGGESMKAVRAVRTLDDALPVLDLFAHPTVRALAAHLDSREGGATHLLHRLKQGNGTTALVCVPFGGGGAISYRDLAANAPHGWDVHALELPGHDYARRDEPLESIPALAARAADEILAEPRGELVLYGHCVGGALTVALAQELERRGAHLRGVVVGGNFPAARMPGVFSRLARLWPGSRMSDRALEDSLRVLGGVDGALADDERRVLARNVRHDGEEAERFFTAAFANDVQRLQAPLLCVVGGADRMSDFAHEQVHEWALFSDRVELAVIPGAEHFFNRSHAPELGALIERWHAGGGEPLPPRRSRARLTDFLIVALGQLVSLIGTGLTTFALGVWAFQQTGRLTTFATVQIVGILPAIVAAPFAGALADRFDRRRIMIACELVGAATAAALVTVVAMHTLALWHVYVLAGIGAAAVAFQQPAYLAGATQLVPKRYLGNANGLLQLSSAGGLVFAQLLGGAVMALLGLGGAVVIDAASYLFALGTLLVVRFPDAAFRRRDEPFTREIVNGWKYLLARRPLVALTAFFTVVNGLSGIAFVLATPLVLSFASTATLGAVLAMQGVGMVAGAAVMTAWGGARRRVLGMVATVGLFGVSALIIGLHPSAGTAAAGMFGIGVCGSLITAHWLALVNVKVPTDMQGRVVSTCLMCARLLTPIAYVTIGPLVALLGHHAGRPLAVAMVLTALVALAWTAAGLASRTLRAADDLPDASPARR